MKALRETLFQTFMVLEMVVAVNAVKLAGNPARGCPKRPVGNPQGCPSGAANPQRRLARCVSSPVGEHACGQIGGRGETTSLGSLALSLLKLRTRPIPLLSGPCQPLPMQEREDLPVNILLSESGLEVSSWRQCESRRSCPPTYLGIVLEHMHLTMPRTFISQRPGEVCAHKSYPGQ